MMFTIRHRTTYDYDHDVSLSHHVLRLTPRPQPGRRVVEHELACIPPCSTRSTHVDHFGNGTTFLTIEGVHRQLELTASSIIEIDPVGAAAPSPATPQWESIQSACALDEPLAPLDAVEMVFASPLISPRIEFAEFARISFIPDRPVLDAARDLSGRIHRE